MAFKKSVDLGNGFSADYWSFHDIHIQLSSGAVKYEIGLYKDQSYKRSGVAPLREISYTFILSEEEMNDLKSNGIKKIKEQTLANIAKNDGSKDFLDDAEDIIDTGQEPVVVEE